MWGWLGGQAWAASSEIYTYRRIALREPHRAPVPAWHTASTEISRHKVAYRLRPLASAVYGALSRELSYISKHKRKRRGTYNYKICQRSVFLEKGKMRL